MYNARDYAAANATSWLGTLRSRGQPTERDVQIEILFCGICHSDLHSVHNEQSSVMPLVYPIVARHEIVGAVTRIGSAVSKLQRGKLGNRNKRDENKGAHRCVP